MRLERSLESKLKNGFIRTCERLKKGDYFAIAAAAAAKFVSPQCAFVSRRKRSKNVAVVEAAAASYQMLEVRRFKFAVFCAVVENLSVSFSNEFNTRGKNLVKHLN